MRRWFTWGILIVAFIIVFFHRLSMGVVADQIARELSLNSVQIGKLTAMTFYGYALMQIPVGIMVDRLGVRIICTVGMAITALSSIILGSASSSLWGYFARFMVGVGTSVVIISIMKVQSELFPKKMYSTLSGITSCFGNLGALLATFPLVFAANYFGWRGTFKILAFITFVVSLSIFAIIEKTPKEERSEEKVPMKKEIGVILNNLKCVFKNKYTWPNFFLMMFFVGSLTAVLGLWGTGFLRATYGISIDKAAYYVSFIIYGFIIGAPIVGKLSDFLNGKVKGILLTGTTGYFLIWFYILVIKKGAPRIEFLPVLFLFMGLFLITHILAFSNVKNVNRDEHLGIATAVVNTGEFIGGGIISMIIGEMVLKLGAIYSEPAQVYRIAMSVITVVGFLSIISVIFMKDGSVVHERDVVETFK